ncbi:unnamed protein product [Urochloa decumbens]|uniref:Fucosyltransferase n=1 Tax=Urochloa decumbens TaxID=240449 RepID=A0ABC9F384_9POAL
MDQLLPCRGSSAARRRWCRPAARPSSALAIAASVAAALLLAVVLFGVRLTPSGGNNSWVFDGGRDVLKSGAAGPLATVPDPRDPTLGGLLSPDFNDSACLSRYRAVLYRHPSLHAISSHLVSALRRYESLHRQCGPGTPAYARAVERLRAAPNASTTPPSSSSSDCSYLVWNPVEGLGNRILSITSGFLYALLTDRVLLLHSSGGDLDDLFCEPFPGSTWILPAGDKDDFPIRDMEQLGQGHHESLGAVLGRGEDPGAASPWLYAHLVHNYDAQDRRFFCDDAQAALRRVPWLVFHSDSYFAPGLFLIPGEQHERELSPMFPRRDLVFHHLGRYLFHPSNTVWDMVMRYHDEYFAKADERVGIQVRTFGWAPISTDELYSQILKCTQRENILPVPSTGELVTANDGQPAKRKAVVVVSLHGEYSEKLRELYQKDSNGSTATGREAVSVYQPTHLGEQRSGEKEHNQQAFAEMVLLGFSDAVVTTAASTFGYVGQGLAGLRPWVLMSPVDEKAPDTPCRHAPTIEPCFHSPPNYDCRAKVEGDAGRMVRHIRHCEDYPQGVQLVE